MHIAITGANGFVGRALAARLISEARLGGQPIGEVTLLDLTFDARSQLPIVRFAAGDISDAQWLRKSLPQPLDAVFHLASIPGGIAEQNYELGRKVNLDATSALLECCKCQVDDGGRLPVFVFASTIAVFGQMPGRVTDETLPRPMMTYGAQKVIGEVLVADFSRRNWVDGRSLRLPGVLARPPAQTGQLSAFMSDIIRELAAGRPFICPTSPNATTWASSLPCIVENLVHAATVPIQDLQGRCTFTLPTLRFSMAELVEAIGEVYGSPARELVRYEPNERIEALFGSFPPLETPAAEAAGFRHDGDLRGLVRRALELG